MIALRLWAASVLAGALVALSCGGCGGSGPPSDTTTAASPPNAAGAMAVWLRLTVPAGSLPYKGAATIQTSGSTV